MILDFFRNKKTQLPAINEAFSNRKKTRSKDGIPFIAIFRFTGKYKERWVKATPRPGCAIFPGSKVPELFLREARGGGTEIDTDKMTLEIDRIDIKEGTTLFYPVYENEEAQCFDIHAKVYNEEAKLRIGAKDYAFVDTGITVELDEGYQLLIVPTHQNSGFSIVNGFMMIDHTFTDSISIPLINLRQEDIYIRNKEPIAQCFIIKTVKPRKWFTRREASLALDHPERM